MKKIITISLLLCASLVLNAQDNEFFIEEPKDISDQSISLKQRLQATQKMIWVLPDNYWNETGVLSYECWVDPLIEHFKSLGFACRIFKYKGEYFPAPQMTKEFPGTPKASIKSIAYAISNEKFYNYSDLIIIPEIGAQGFTVYSKLNIYDLYQDLLWSPTFIAKGLSINSNKSSIKKDVAKKFPERYSFDEDYQYIRRGYTTNWTLDSFKSYAENKGLQRFEGIYQKDNQQFFVKKKGVYYYLVACGKASRYLEGDIKGELTPTATPNIFLGAWNEGGQDDSYKNSTYVFNDVGLEFQSGSIKRLLIKVWPTSDSDGIDVSEGKKWTGTGWSLRNGYVVTNDHVARGAKTIYINATINGESYRYPAKIVALDQTDDLAILYVEDLRNVNIPYSAKSSLCSVGEKCFALGYPMSDRLGQEVKLTDGVISSRTGFQNDMKLYQISAAVQPGNSGCPLFDEAGNVVGIVNSGVPSADNVGYAIKMSYLRTLLVNYELENALPSGTDVQQLKTLPEKVDVLRNYIYLIECSDTAK